MTGNDKAGWTLFEKQGGPDGNLNNRALTFSTLEAFRKSGIGDSYDGAARIKTSPEQDAAMKAAGDESYNRPYLLGSENCSDLVATVAGAAGVDVRPERSFAGFSIPNTQFEKANKLGTNARYETTSDKVRDKEKAFLDGLKKIAAMGAYR